MLGRVTKPRSGLAVTDGRWVWLVAALATVASAAMILFTAYGQVAS